MTLLRVETISDDEVDLGGPNEPPRNLRHVSENEIITSTPFAHYSPKYRAYKQVYLDPSDRPKGRLTALNIMIYDDGSGVAYTTDYWAAFAKRERPEHPDADRASILWWRFDGPCDHEYVTTRLGNAWHQLDCTKCGYSYEIDSSG